MVLDHPIQVYWDCKAGSPKRHRFCERIVFFQRSHAAVIKKRPFEAITNNDLSLNNGLRLVNFFIDFQGDGFSLRYPQ